MFTEIYIILATYWTASFYKFASASKKTQSNLPAQVHQSSRHIEVNGHPLEFVSGPSVTTVCSEQSAHLFQSQPI